MQPRAGDTVKKQRRQTTPARQFVAGAVAGIVASTVLTPLEVIKTRLQSSTANRMRLDRLFRHVLRTEGVRGLFRGVGLNVLGVGPARAVHFSAYNASKTLLRERLGLTGAAQHFFAGAMASTTAATVTSPIWVIKTRMQLLTGPVTSSGASTAQERAYASPLRAARSILQEEGVRGLFRGLSASYLGVGESAIQFALYEWLRAHYLKSVLDSRDPDMSELTEGSAPTPHPLATFLLGAASKLVATCITYPHEVIRTRLRELPPEGSGGKPQYVGIVQTAKAVVAKEGVRGLYGGMLAHVARTVPNAAILLLVVELVSGRGL